VKGLLAEVLVVIGGLIVAAGLALVYLPVGIVACGLLIAAVGVFREVR
jgi:hypothetical protein